MFFSIVICTHNPDKKRLNRVLDGLRNQTVCIQDTELLIIDNASPEALADRLDLTWHERARVIREKRRGVVNARVRGLREARGQWVLFIDDDNVLDANYLEKLGCLITRYPAVAIFSAGLIRPEFDRNPDSALMPHLGVLALREIESDVISNSPEINDASGPTAGMCVRKECGLAWADSVAGDEIRSELGRRAVDGLGGAEDLDLNLFTLASGVAVGSFRDLRLTHLIPAHRIELPYLLELTRDLARANVTCELQHFPRKTVGRRLLLPWYWLRYWFLPAIMRKCLSEPTRSFERARLRGRFLAYAGLRQGRG